MRKILILKALFWTVVMCISLNILRVSTSEIKHPYNIIDLFKENLINSESIDSKYEKEYDINFNNPKYVDVKLNADSIVVKKSNSKYIKIIDKSNYNLSKREELNIYKNKDKDTISIDRNDKVMNLGIGLFKNKYRVVEVYIPQEFYGKLSLSNSVGNIDVDTELNLTNLVISQKVGNLNIYDKVVSDKVLIKSSTGNINIDELNSNNYNIDESVGDIHIKKLIGAGEIYVSTGNIDVGIENIKGNVNIKSNTGDIDIEVDNNENFKLFTKVNIGEIDSDLSLQRRQRDKKSLSGINGNLPRYKIEVESSLGNIDICSK